MSDLFFELFEALPRQGPGSSACTQRALALCEGLPPTPRILDLGCGSGGQTLDLAGNTVGTIVAIDNHAPFVERLRSRIAAAGLSNRVEARVADMTALDLPPASFDLVWSEGALYNLGLDRALPMCATLTKPGGCIGFTEAVWRSDERPAEVCKAFADYPTMGRSEEVLPMLERSGWSLLGQFDLPRAAWWDDFYGPMQQRIELLRQTHAHDPQALETLDTLAAEPRMHRDYGDTYGYTFFVARRLA